MVTIIKFETEKIDNVTTILLPTIFVEKATKATKGYTSICFAWLHSMFIIGIKRTKKIAADQENK